jgi:PAS domain S-box-containing protein
MRDEPESSEDTVGSRAPVAARHLYRATAGASLFVMAVAAAAIAGWVLGNESLIRVAALPGAGVMMPITAVSLFLAGAALGLLRRQDSGETPSGQVGRVMAAVAALLGILVLVEYVGRVDLGIDLLLFSERVQLLVDTFPGRPAPATAVGFVAIGLALVLLDVEWRGGLRPSQYLALIPAILGIQVLAGYGYRREAFWTQDAVAATGGGLSPMAINTAACLVALSLGVISARPDRGVMAIVTGRDSGGLLARRLLPAAVLVPLLLGWLRLAGERAGLYGQATGVSLFAVSTMVVFAALIGWSAAILRRLDRARAGAETALRNSESRYRSLVETANEGIWVVDQEARTDFVNRRMAEMLGYSVEEMLGRPVFDFMPAEERSHAAELVSRRMAGLSEIHEFRLTRRDGSVLWVLMSTSPVLDAQGRVVGALAMASDITARKRTESELQESEERFRSIFEKAGIGIVVADTEGRFQLTNPAIQRFVGRSASQLRGTSFTEITHPDDVDLDWGLFQELLAGKRDFYQIEKRYLHADGRVVWGRLTGSIVRDPSGGYAHAIGMVEDVTSRKELEEERARLTAVLEATPDFVATLDPEGRLISLNRAGRGLVGLDEDEDASRYTISDFLPLQSLSAVLGEAIPAAIRDGAWSGETTLVARDGRQIPVSQVILAHRARSGEVDFLSTVMRSISERIAREEDERFLLEASRRLTESLEEEGILLGFARLLAERRGDYCVIDRVEADGEVLRPLVVHRDPATQPLADALADFPPVPGRRPGAASVLQTGEPEHLVAVSEAWLHAVAIDADHLALLRRLGLRRQVVVPIRTRKRIIGAITLARTTRDEPFSPSDIVLLEDLAVRSAVALENCRLYLKSQQATRTRDEVLRIVAHDLRNPLATISLAAAVLEELIPDTATDAHHHLHLLQRSVQLSDRLIQDLLDVAKMEAGRLIVTRASLPTAHLVKEAVELQRPLAQEKGLRLRLELSENLPRISADRDRLLQVFANLIGNAIKFTPEAGSIAVAAMASEGTVRFSVTDSGPGISEKDRDRLFDPFWQADAGGAGAGLGLALARGIVEAHGGAMEVWSREGEGSTFSFTIPVETSPRTPLPSAAPRAEG